MRTFARIVIPVLALAVSPLVTTPASASEILNFCSDHDVEVRVNGVACVGINYPSLPPSGS